jgi:hypothetical protein
MIVMRAGRSYEMQDHFPLNPHFAIYNPHS